MSRMRRGIRKRSVGVGGRYKIYTGDRKKKTKNNRL